MSAAIVCIGTEITRGEIVNTNATWIATELTQLGFDVHEIAVVEDDPARIIACLRRLGASSSILVCTGGLGPTTDDLTADAVARALGVSLVRDERALEAIRRRFEAIGRPMSPSNAKQADLPEGAEMLPNPVGTAPGFAIAMGRARAYFLPGVPREMQRIFADAIAPSIRALAPANTFQIRLKTFGLPESVVGEKLAGLEETNPGLTIGYRASFPEIEVKIHVRAASQDEAHIEAGRLAAEARARLGEVVYGEGDDTFPAATLRALRQKGLRLALAESCTGGLIGHWLTRQPASDVLVADAVTYANGAKTRLLGVSEDAIRGHGAVSPEVAAAMAEGARRVCDADIALAITGVAGPSGGTDEKPVGLVYWAVAHAKGTIVKSQVFPGDRGQIQTRAGYAGLALLRDVCLGRAL